MCLIFCFAQKQDIQVQVCAFLKVTLGHCSAVPHPERGKV
jgi:hypothetical protein